jgi:hypothetical protein
LRFDRTAHLRPPSGGTLVDVLLANVIRDGTLRSVSKP